MSFWSFCQQLWRRYRIWARAVGAGKAGRTPLRVRSTTAQSTGDEMETRALRHLQAAGLQLVARNYRCRYGEIDLIMQSGGALVFVEVRARAHQHFGGAAASITAAKQRRLRRTAQHYLARTKIQCVCRFDAVLIEAGQLHWLKDTMRR